MCALTLLLFLAQVEELGNENNPSFSGMMQRAQQTRVWKVVGDDRIRAELVKQPVFRYSDQPRNILDATLWVWQIEGRPLAFQKVEVYRTKAGISSWLYCFASLFPGIIAAEWEVGEQWEAKKAGIEPKIISGGPPVAASKAARLLQMKQLSRRFSVIIHDDIAKSQEHLRLLPQPLHQYGEVNTTSLEGVVFGFAANGTNPDSLLLVQVRPSDETLVWEYAFVQMTTGGLTAELDKTVVWTAPYRVPNPRVPSKFETWLFFRESAAGGRLSPRREP
jgi:hypothetical protein